MKKPLLYGLIAWAATGLGLQAQELGGDTLRVLHIAQDQGLSQLSALSVDFGSLGHVWIGTQNGLNRYNGHGMKVYMAGQGKDMLPDDHIRELLHVNDTLWLATNTHSICAYLPAEDRFVSFEGELDLKAHPQLKFAHTLDRLSDRYLLAGTVDHVVLIDRKGPTFRVLPISGELSGEYPIALAPYGEHTYLLGTNFDQNFLLDLESLSVRPFGTLGEKGKAFYELDGERLLVGTESGLLILHKKDQRLEKVPVPVGFPPVESIFAWGPNNLFIGGANRSFLLRDLKEWREIYFRDPADKILKSTIYALQKDPQGGYWMGTDGRGVFYHHPHQEKFTSQRIEVGNAPKKDFISIFNFLREGDTLWMATEFGLVNYLFSQDRYKLHLTNNLDYTLAKDQEGTLWAGGFGDGLMRYDRKRDLFERIPLPIDDNEVIQITPVGKDSLWVHTWSSGIYGFNIHDRGIKKKVVHGKSLIRARNSLIDSKGAIWLASDDGLYRIHKGTETSYGPLTNPRVFAITEDPRGNIWVGTGKGLNRIDAKTEQITHYTQQEGLPNDFIYGVESDARGNIWVSTNYGLSQLIVAEQRFKNYTERDGLQNNEFNGKAAYKDDLGRLYFGGMDGFNIFHPDSIPINKKLGRTVVESVELMGRPLGENIPYTDKLVFSHHQNVIGFNFSSLNYLWPEKNRYRFMLEGFDKDWRPVTKDRSTTYTNLDPGTYTFRVMGSNNEMLWGEPAELQILIKSPWYATAGFRGGMVGALLLSLLGIVKYRDNQQKKRNVHLARMVEERTRELTRSNLALNTSLDLTNRQKENITFLMQELNHRVKNNLQLIISLIDFQNVDQLEIMENDQLKQLQYRVFTVAKIHDMLVHGEVVRDNIKFNGFMEKLARELIDFSGIPIALQLDVIAMEFPSNKLTYVGLILNELITNSIKHAFTEGMVDPTIKIYLGREGKELKFEYRDNGKGLPGTMAPDQGNKGLGLIWILARELEGRYGSRTDQGAVFTFYFKSPIPHINEEERTDT